MPCGADETVEAVGFCVELEGETVGYDKRAVGDSDHRLEPTETQRTARRIQTGQRNIQAASIDGANSILVVGAY